MRLWSLHPRFLDRQGLLGQWREALQAANALRDPHHSSNVCHARQLQRFKAALHPLDCLSTFLHAVADEMLVRGYKPNLSLIPYSTIDLQKEMIPVTQGQVDYEIQFLRQKLLQRNPPLVPNLDKIRDFMFNQLNPVFFEVGGEIEPWEKIR